MRLTLPLVLLGLAFVWFMSSRLTLSDQGRVVGTPHDLGVATLPGVSPCETCHLPHEAGGQPLWAEDPRPDGSPLSGLKPLCYSCHDDTVAAGSYAFDPDRAQHPVTPGKVGEDCDSCHDPHVSDYGSFLLFPSAANLCRVCHARSGGGNHPLDVDAMQTGNVPEDASWNPDGGDFNGTRLWDATGSGSGNSLKCLTCHAAHAAASDSGLLTIRDRDEVGLASSLCLNCHQR